MKNSWVSVLTSSQDGLGEKLTHHARRSCDRVVPDVARRSGNHVPNRTRRRGLRRRLNLAVFDDREVYDIILDVGVRAVRVKSQVEPLHDRLENGTDARRGRLDGRAVLDAVVDRGGSRFGKGVTARCVISMRSTRERAKGM